MANSVDPNLLTLYLWFFLQVLTRTIEGLGQHGMVGTTDQSLMNLHDALRIEFNKVQYVHSCIWLRDVTELLPGWVIWK